MPDQQPVQSKRWVNTRRSQRVLLRVPVLVRGQVEGDSSLSEETHTLVVSADGALIALAMRVQFGQKLVLKSCASGEEVESYVVHVGEKEASKAEVGIAFAHPARHFWHIDFPPADRSKPLPE